LLIVNGVVVLLGAKVQKSFEFLSFQIGVACFWLRIIDYGYRKNL